MLPDVVPLDHNGALTPAEVTLIVICATVAVPERFARGSARLGNAALALFAIHAPIFLILMKVLKLASIGESPLRCALHFGACVAASKHVEPSMATYPLYLAGTAVAAVYFQERCVAPLRDRIRARLLAPGKDPAANATITAAYRGHQPSRDRSL